MGIKITSEKEMRNWFEKNFYKFGYKKILKRDSGTFPDFIMQDGNGEKRVELELLSSHFILHKHDVKKVDEVICICKDVDINVPVVLAEELDYNPRLRRISATVDKRTVVLIDFILKKRIYRNKSHVIEAAVELLSGGVDE